jgi:hypothetical protein
MSAKGTYTHSHRLVQEAGDIATPLETAQLINDNLSNALQMTRPLDNEAVRAWTLVEIVSAPSFSAVVMVD